MAWPCRFAGRRVGHLLVPCTNFQHVCLQCTYTHVLQGGNQFLFLSQVLRKLVCFFQASLPVGLGFDCIFSAKLMTSLSSTFLVSRILLTFFAYFCLHSYSLFVLRSPDKVYRYMFHKWLLRGDGGPDLYWSSFWWVSPPSMAISSDQKDITEHTDGKECREAHHYIIFLPYRHSRHRD